MYSIFYYIKIDLQYYFYQSMLDYYYFSRLLEIKINIEGVKCRFQHKGEGNVIQASLRGGE